MEFLTHKIIKEINLLFTDLDIAINFLIAMGIFFGVYFLLKFVRRRILQYLARKQQEQVKVKAIIKYLSLSRTYFIIAVSLFVSSHLVVLTPGVTHFIQIATNICFFLQFAIWANVFLTNWIDDFIKNRAKTSPSIVSAQSLFKLFARVSIWTVVILLVLNNLGYDTSTLLAGLGIGGIAIGLASQKILGDLFASISIILDNPFAVGDVISFGEFKGTVEYIGLKTTHIRSKTGELIVCSNADLIGTRIKNLSRIKDLKVTVQLTISSDTDKETLKEIPSIVQNLIQNTPPCEFIECYFSSYSQGSVVFELSYYIPHAALSDENIIKQKVNYLISDLFEEKGIRFAYPTHRILLEQKNGFLEQLALEQKIVEPKKPQIIEEEIEQKPSPKTDPS